MLYFLLNQWRLRTLFCILSVLLFISPEGYGQQPLEKNQAKYAPGVIELLLKSPSDKKTSLMVMTSDTKPFLDSLMALKEIRVVSLYEPTNTFIIYTPVKYINRIASWHPVLFIDKTRAAKPELFTGTIENKTNVVKIRQAQTAY